MPGLHTFTLEQLTRINLFSPGDYQPYMSCNECMFKYDYHQCEFNPNIRMGIALMQVRNKNIYSSLKLAIADYGFLAPLGAKLTEQGIVLIDGHTRLAIAQELDLPSVPVYVSAYGTNRMDIIAMDSNFWKEGVDSPWMTG